MCYVVGRVSVRVIEIHSPAVVPMLEVVVFVCFFLFVFCFLHPNWAFWNCETSTTQHQLNNSAVGAGGKPCLPGCTMSNWSFSSTKLFSPPSAFQSEVQRCSLLTSFLDDCCNYKSLKSQVEAHRSHSGRVELGRKHRGCLAGEGDVSQGNQEVFWEQEAPEIMSNGHLLTRREQMEGISNKRKTPCHSTGIEIEARLWKAFGNFKLINFYWLFF